MFKCNCIVPVLAPGGSFTSILHEITIKKQKPSDLVSEKETELFLIFSKEFCPSILHYFTKHLFHLLEITIKSINQVIWSANETELFLIFSKEFYLSIFYLFGSVSFRFCPQSFSSWHKPSRGERLVLLLNHNDDSHQQPPEPNTTVS